MKAKQKQKIIYLNLTRKISEKNKIKHTNKH